MSGSQKHPYETTIHEWEPTPHTCKGWGLFPSHVIYKMGKSFSSSMTGHITRTPLYIAPCLISSSCFFLSYGIPPLPPLLSFFTFLFLYFIALALLVITSIWLDFLISLPSSLIVTRHNKSYQINYQTKLLLIKLT